MTSPRHLWSGRWQEESDAARAAAPPEDLVGDAATLDAEPGAGPDATHTHGATPPPSSGRAGGRPPLRPVAILLAGLVLITAGAFAVSALRDDHSNTKTTAETLPASTTPAPEPKNSSAQAVNAAAGPSVASVRTSSGEGSGFLVRDNRTLVTNAHVVDGATNVTVRFGSSGSALDGRVRGRDESSDLAVVQLLDTPPKDAKPLRLADSDRLAVGQEVIAIGNPFGLAGSLTEGVVSGLGRPISAPNGFSIENAIQTDAAINHGNSGGPLLDTAGRVVGVNSQIETGGTSGGNVGVGFAVPSNTVARVAPVLAAGKTYEHAWLGIAGPPATSGGEAPAIIQGVTAGGPAGAAGLRVGDKITAVGGKGVKQFGDVVKAIDNAKPGDKVDVHVQRNGGDTTHAVTLGTRPATPQP
jgi:putative serine protease PepD